MTTQIPSCAPGANPQPPFDTGAWCNVGHGLWNDRTALSAGGNGLLIAGTRDRILPANCNPGTGLDFDCNRGEYYMRNPDGFLQYGTPALGPIPAGADGALMSASNAGPMQLTASCEYDRTFQVLFDAAVAYTAENNIRVNSNLFVTGATNLPNGQVNPPIGYADVAILAAAPIGYAYTVSPARVLHINVAAGTTATLDGQLRASVNNGATPGGQIDLYQLAFYVSYWDA